MSDYVRTPVSQTGEAVPVGRPDASNGVRVVALVGQSSSSEALLERVYLVSVTVPAFVSLGADPAAGDMAGSLLLGPGAVYPFSVEEGDRFAVLAVDQPGALLALPLGQA